MNPRQQVRTTAWNACEDELPAVFDGPILVYFPETEAIETVNCEHFFALITAGVDEQGNQKWTRWYLSHTPRITHWAHVPEPPHVYTD